MGVTFSAQAGLTSTLVDTSPDLLADPRHVLRPAQDSDVARWFEAVHDPDQLALGLPAFVDPPVDHDAVRERLAKAREAAIALRPAPVVLADAVDGRFLALGSWRHDSPPPMGVADIGYLVHPDARGRGVATALITLLARWLTGPDGPGLSRVQLDHSTENVGSCRAALRAGFAREGVRRAFLPLRGPGGDVRRHDVCLHGWLPGDVAQPSAAPTSS